MGLDMFLQGRTHIWAFGSKNVPTKDGFPVSEMVLDLGYWRKHPDLHGYIVNTFADGKDECQEIPLSAENLIDIIAAVKEGRLPKTSGFFFGESIDDLAHRNHDIDTFSKALQWLEGKPHIEPMTKPQPLGGGMVMQMVDLEAVKHLSESRSVYYRASW
jgi:hypothetical protein